MKKKAIKILISIIIILLITTFVVYFELTKPYYKILQSEKIGLKKIVLYELDYGAGGTKSINLTIGLYPNLRNKGNIYSSLLIGDSDSYFEIKDNNKICLFLKEDEKIVFNKNKQIENILICYEYETD